MKFSEKYGYTPVKAIQVESMDEVLRIRLINVIQKYVFAYADLSLANYLLDKFGYYTNLQGLNPSDFSNLLKQSETKWYILYDIIDLIIEFADFDKDFEDMQEFCNAINKILEEEKSGYRIVKKEITPITNPNEIKAIEQAASTKFDSVNKHITKALNLYADREKPDYENSIKESISAVESMCCVITGLSGANATLGKALKKLQEHGVNIHPAMEKAFTSLYGYTSDEDGIRHGGIDFAHAPEEDAKFMLIACSAFVNYLVEKYSKIE